MIECQKKNWKGRCCCNCHFHFKDYSTQHWVCVPGFERAYSNWEEHGMCEYHMFREAQ